MADDVVVFILAHNEADSIGETLASLPSACSRRDFRAVVVANGCTDRTVDIARALKLPRGTVEVIDLKVGDKCNAWNHAIHHSGLSAAHYVFMDGDVRASPNSIDELLRSLERDPKALAATGLPGTGRTREQFRAAARDEGGIAGNLYSLRASFVDRLRSSRVSLPVGFVGDDSVIGALVMWDLDPRGAWIKERIAVCEGAEFEFESVSPFNSADIKLQWRRMRRYSRRRYEMQMLGRALRAGGIAAMPKHRDDLYRKSLGDCRVSWRGAWTLFDALALREMRRMIGAG